MLDSEIRRAIHEEIKKQLGVILYGAVGNPTVDSETIEAMYPGMPNQPERPLVGPYGVASVAPTGTIQVVGRIGDHPANRVVLGHRAKDRPTDLAEGETTVYSLGEFRLVVKNDSLYLGKGTDLEEMVVGETLRQFLISLVDLIVAHTHLGNLGYDTSPPKNFADFVTARTDNLDNSKILAKEGGRF